MPRSSRLLLWPAVLAARAACAGGPATTQGVDAVAADAVVAADGSGQYTTVRAAVDAAPQITRDTGRRWTIRVKPGTYRELVYVQREKRFVRLVGDDAAACVLTYDLSANLPGPDGRPIGTFHTPTLQIDADDFAVQNLTIANAAGRKGQALALRIDGDRVTLRDCRLLGWQDTLLVNRGRHYFEGCTIEGATDFVFGGATAWFQGCTLHAAGDGYLTAASTPDFARFGYVFADCRVTAGPGVKTYLGRPWRDYAKVLFLNTELPDAVRPEGWHDWNKPQAHATTFFGEFASRGPGAAGGSRAPWAHALTDAEAAGVTVNAVLAGADGWDPRRP